MPIALGAWSVAMIVLLIVCSLDFVFQRASLGATVKLVTHMAMFSGAVGPVVNLQKVKGVSMRANRSDTEPVGEDHRWERIRFKGSGIEDSKIWIVDMFLSIVSLWIYSAWAKV